MKTCTYCGKKYPDESAQSQCEIDGALLETGALAQPPVIIDPPANSQFVSSSLVPRLSDRNIRIAEIILVCVIAFASSILASAYSFFGSYPEGVNGGAQQWTYAIVHEGAALGLLWYVLQRRSRSLPDIGFRWRWADIGWSVALYAGGYFVFALAYRTIFFSGLSTIDEETANGRVAHQLFNNGIFLVTLIFTVINPFFEELIVRAYLMTEIREATNSATKAIVCSTLLQTSYHLYQGVPLTIAEGAMFFLWSLYYAKTNRIIPIILAHLYFDVGSTLWYLFRHQIVAALGTS
jgi:membrane protease YdiL (CAAX protease family)